MFTCECGKLYLINQIELIFHIQKKPLAFLIFRTVESFKLVSVTYPRSPTASLDYVY